MAGINKTLMMVVLGLVFSSAVGCSLKKDMDKMADTTKKMDRKMGDLAKDTKGAKDAAINLGEKSAIAFGMPQVEEHYKELVEDTSTLGKLAHAISYFYAFPFQHWRGEHFESVESREESMALAVEKFFSHVNILVDDGLVVDKFFLDNEWLSLAAFSVGMSRIFPDQERFAKRNNFKPYSMYSLITEGLSMKARSEAGEGIPRWASIVLRHEQVAYYLLQLRHNYFPLVLVSRLSNLEDPIELLGGLVDITAKARLLLFRHFSWHADISQLNREQTLELEDWLTKMDHTRIFLVQQGIPLEYLSHTVRVLENMVLLAEDPENLSATTKSFVMRMVGTLNINSTILKKNQVYQAQEYYPPQ